MHKGYFSAAALMAALAVALGAFGAHGLKTIVPPETVAAFQTGVQYQMYHALALLITAVIFDKLPSKYMNRAAICFITGIILFSGSLYLLTVFKATDTVGLQGIGAVTPIGGLFFIAGWLFLVFSAVKKN
jgi:uncharacterized membrane protein YgdD (TMEM256/DUF423 family)